MSSVACNFDYLRLWLRDIRSNTALECMCVLQGKSLVDNISARFANKEFAKVYRLRASKLAKVFNKLIVKLNRQKWSSVPITLLRVAKEVQSVVNEGQLGNRFNAEDVKCIEQEISTSASCLISWTDEKSVSSIKHADKLETETLSLYEKYCQWLEYLLSSEIQASMKVLSSSADASLLMEAADSIICLCLDNEHACETATKNDGIKILLQHCIPNKVTFSPDVCSHILRTIATVCTFSDAIDLFQKANGFQQVTHLLLRYDLPEVLRAEAAGVIAQVTSPLLTTPTTLILIDVLEDVVSAVTALCSQCSSADVLLLASAALANLCLIDSMTCEYLSQCNTVPILLMTCSKFNSSSVLFVCDQVVTIIYSMLNMNQLAADVEDVKLVHFLSSLADSDPSHYHNVELSTHARIVKKAQLALQKYHAALSKNN